MLTIHNFKPTGDIRRDYHAHSEIIVNHFIEREVVRTVFRKSSPIKASQSERINEEGRGESSVVLSNIEVENSPPTEGATRREKMTYQIASNHINAEESCVLTMNKDAEYFGEYREEIINGIIHFLHRRDLTPEEERNIDDAVEDSESSDDEHGEDDESDDGEDYKAKIVQRLERAKQRRLNKLGNRADKAQRKIIHPHQMIVAEKYGGPRINTDIYVTNPKSRLEYVDVYCLTRALETKVFRLTNLRLVGCGLSCRTLIQLSDAVAKYCTDTLRIFSVEMNPFNRVSEDNEVKGHVEDYVDAFQARQINSAFPNEEATEDGDRITFNRAIRSFMNSGIMHLSLRSCDIGEEGAAIVGEVLRSDSKIISISLFGNQIGDIGVKHIANAMLSNRRLQSLDFGLNNDMTDVAVGHLSDSFRETVFQSEEEFMEIRKMVYLSEYGPVKLHSMDSIPDYSFNGQGKNMKERGRTKRDPEKVERLEEWESMCRIVGGPPEGTPKKRSTKSQENSTDEYEPVRFIIPGNTTLRHLGLSCNRNLTDSSVHAFLAERTNISNLERLNFSRTAVNEDALMELATRLSNNS